MNSIYSNACPHNEMIGMRSVHFSCNISLYYSWEWTLSIQWMIVLKAELKSTNRILTLSRYRKLEIQLRVKTDSLYLTTPKHSGGEISWQCRCRLQTQWRCRYHRQCRCSKPGSAESPARAENTVQSAPYRDILKRDQARTASGPGRLTQRVSTPQQ